MWMPVIFGSVVIAYVIYCAFSGSIRTSKYRHGVVHRRENPGCFWSALVVEGLVGVGLFVLFWLNYRRR
jgi:uncharacterized membrane protein YfcA